ncbi:MAG TPA: DedA family protein, partial [Immundisolibacter sp.]|nr:DedA family protein [Immundisolibacter sp.]
MELLHTLLDLFLHLDTHLAEFTANYGVWVYALLALVVFCETGLVVTPFLPGDSLLFVVGTLAAGGLLDFGTAAAVLFVSAVVGDSVNYAIGHAVGPRVYARPDSRWLRQEHLARTRAFFERHGGKTIVLARFVPIVRTFAPFVAGVGSMHYRRFLAYNVFGAAVWVLLFMTAGVVFGQLPLAKNNLTLIALGIVVVSLLPVAVHWLQSRRTGMA